VVGEGWGSVVVVREGWIRWVLVLVRLDLEEVDEG
jgi:hypothetical protein